uniref:Uncharacterized protein n=1 Tax=Anguilla anguilla TaxID=7936 RepID=A0A0E9WQW9_ANGAN
MSIPGIILRLIRVIYLSCSITAFSGKHRSRYKGIPNSHLFFPLILLYNALSAVARSTNHTSSA